MPPFSTAFPLFRIVNPERALRAANKPPISSAYIKLLFLVREQTMGIIIRQN
jgi:hypothetical protein